jgi:hypothetical protein
LTNMRLIVFPSIYGLDLSSKSSHLKSHLVVSEMVLSHSWHMSICKISYCMVF